MDAKVLRTGTNITAIHIVNCSVKWTESTWDEWDAPTMFAALRLRADVFVVEQDCVYPDLDDKDVQSIHLVAMAENAQPGQPAMATARMVPPGVSYAEPSIGRVVSAQSERGGGLGRELMERAIRICQRRWPRQAIRISAQQYLIRFYEELGFACAGEGYLEDGIPHIEMVRQAENVGFWIERHAAVVAQFGEALAAVPADQKKGNSEHWGAAEVIQHLQLSEHGLRTYLAKKSNAQWSVLPQTDLDSDRAGMKIIGALKSNRRWEDPTKGAISPNSNAIDADEAWANWIETHDSMWDSMEEMFRDSGWWTVKLFRHPLAGYLSLSDTFAFASAHIAHHIKQLERLHA
ncbi:MAG: GNAT family N-acetyltransferase [Crocinitomicaceae bacterium]|nr:GNAT family N-acetyltransferase [Crocinitomicaceae bacterium]